MPNRILGHTTGTYKGRKYNGGSELQAMKMADKMLSTKKKRRKKNGCYVATAVYGSYDCPEVWTLRRFRDDTLAGTWYGRAFIRFYYAVSPTVVSLFGRQQWFTNRVRPHLDKMVQKLNESGTLDTPYEDKEWYNKDSR